MTIKAVRDSSVQMAHDNGHDNNNGCTKTAIENLNVDAQPGGGREQPIKRVLPTPNAVKANQSLGTPAGYKSQAEKDGIPYRPHGLFPPNDALLAKLVGTPNTWPFEKHLPTAKTPYSALPHGGWITGDSAAQRGIDLRLFYQERMPGATAENNGGLVLGAVRFGDGAAIGTGQDLFYLSAHGGAIETVLDEATAELGKIEFQPFLSTREATFSIKKPVPLHETLGVRCVVTQKKGLRCWVEGQIESSDGTEVYATCRAQLVDMVPFIQQSDS